MQAFYTVQMVHTRMAFFLWGLYGVSVLCMGVSYLMGNTVHAAVKNPFLYALTASIPVVLLLLHSLWLFGFRRALFFVALTSSMGLLAEVLGVHTGVVFSGVYSYRPSQLMLWSVPFHIMVYWSVFAYMGFCMVTSFRMWWGGHVPQRGFHSVWFPIALACADAVVVTLLDTAMDPLQVYAGAWRWEIPGPYFGVPWGNFVGWFVIVFLASVCFRTLEFMKPSHSADFPSHLFLIPVGGYALAGVVFGISALQLRMYPVFLASLVMVLVSLANAVAYRGRVNRAQ